MTTNPFEQQQTSLKEIDFAFYVRHYLRLFWKWRLYILFVVPFVGLLASAAIVKIGFLKSPPLSATTIIGQDVSKNRTFDDFGGGGQNKERLLLGRSFINSIVQKLSLQLVIAEHSRYDVFDSVFVDTTALIGSFKFVIDKKNNDNYAIVFSNKSAGIRNKVIESGSMASLQHVSLQGVYLRFSRAFLKEPYSFDFSILSSRFAIDRVLSKLKVTVPDFRAGKYYFTVTLDGSDYPLITQTVNAIADYFVSQNLQLKKARMQTALKEFERQLATADHQLSESKGTLKAFLTMNPSVGLSLGTQQSMTELITLESGSNESKSNIDEAQSLKDKWKNATPDDKVPIANEMIVFLQTRGSIAAPALQTNLNQLLAEKDAAVQNYAKSHPIFSEIESKLNGVYSRALQALETYIIQQRKIINDRNISIQKITSKLQGLPSQELQLAELQKKQDIASDIYSKLLARYNEAKVAETVEDSDVYIMEYAVQPIPPSSLLQMAKSAGIVLALMLLFGFGPAIGLDLIDKTAKSEQTLVKLLPYTFLEVIPRITMPKPDKSQPQVPYEGEILINTPDIQPASAAELFMSLTTKIHLHYYDIPDKSLVVTSLEMNEGKSTVAANLAISFAEYGTKTVLIDCDLRRGVAHKILNVKKTPGLSDYLLEKIRNQNATINIPIVQTDIPNLSIIPAGQLTDNPQKMLQCAALSELKNELHKNNYFIIFDSPPIAVTADSAILSNIVSRYLLVIRAGTTNVVRLKNIIHKGYPMIEKKVIGSVLNMGEDDVPRKYYSYYYNNSRISKRSQG